MTAPDAKGARCPIEPHKHPGYNRLCAGDNRLHPDPKPAREAECEECGGSGRFTQCDSSANIGFRSLPCTVCRGTGRIPAGKEDDHG